MWSDEHLRQLIVGTGNIRDEWKHVAVDSDGTATIHLKDGKTKMLGPSAAETPRSGVARGSTNETESCY